MKERENKERKREERKKRFTFLKNQREQKEREI